MKFMAIKKTESRLSGPLPFGKAGGRPVGDAWLGAKVLPLIIVPFSFVYYIAF
jgi:hypothetical protein